MANSTTMYDSGKTESQRGTFELGPVDGNCLEFWSPPDTAENAHDTGSPQRYEGRLNNNAQR